MNEPPRPALAGSLPDAESESRIYLFKNVAHLRATYQIRILAARASLCGKELVLQVPPTCRFDPGLERLMAKVASIRRENLP